MNLMNELDDSYPQAIYRLLVDGIDIGTKFQDRLISLTIQIIGAWKVTRSR